MIFSSFYSEDIIFYTFSTIPQVLAALVGILAIYIFYRIERVNEIIVGHGQVLMNRQREKIIEKLYDVLRDNPKKYYFITNLNLSNYDISTEKGRRNVLSLGIEVGRHEKLENYAGFKHVKKSQDGYGILWFKHKDKIFLALNENGFKQLRDSVIRKDVLAIREKFRDLEKEYEEIRKEKGSKTKWNSSYSEDYRKTHNLLNQKETIKKLNWRAFFSSILAISFSILTLLLFDSCYSFWQYLPIVSLIFTFFCLASTVVLFKKSLEEVSFK